MNESELERAVGAVGADTFAAYAERCRERGEAMTPAGLLDFAGAANPVAALQRAFGAALERRYPGTRASRPRDMRNQGGAVRRRLVAPQDADPGGHGFTPTGRAADDDGGEDGG
jgi:hypothetical protein